MWMHVCVCVLSTDSPGWKMLQDAISNKAFYHTVCILVKHSTIQYVGRERIEEYLLHTAGINLL